MFNVGITPLEDLQIYNHEARREQLKELARQIAFQIFTPDITTQFDEVTINLEEILPKDCTQEEEEIFKQELEKFLYMA